MIKEKKSAEYVVNGWIINFVYKDDKVIDITVFDDEGEIVFTGNSKKAIQLWEVLDEMQIGDL